MHFTFHFVWSPLVLTVCCSVTFLFHILLMVYFSAGNCIVITCYPHKLIDAYHNSSREKVACNSH